MEVQAVADARLLGQPPTKPSQPRGSSRPPASFDVALSSHQAHHGGQYCRDQLSVLAPLFSARNSPPARGRRGSGLPAGPRRIAPRFRRYGSATL